MNKVFNNFDKKQIEYDDDLVLVYDDSNSNLIYKGIEDFEPMKDCDWIWNSSMNLYQYENYIKICLDI